MIQEPGIDLETLLKKATELSHVGKIVVNKDNLTYLSIDNDYIYEFYYLLPEIDNIKPFLTETIGTHISVIYPQENVKINEEDKAQTHSFEVAGFLNTIRYSKWCYMLKIKSPSLTLLRNKYGLTDKPLFDGIAIDFHITIGTRDLTERE